MTDKELLELTPRDFCLWLQGYLANDNFNVDVRERLLKKLEEVDMHDPRPADPPWSLPIQPVIPPTTPWTFNNKDKAT